MATGFGAVNHTTLVGKYPFMGPVWKEGFRKWYDNALLAVDRAGFDERLIYLYPYDEMEGKQIDDFMEFASWAKKEIPNIKFYATIGSKGSEKALPYLDIAQISNDDELRFRKFTSANADTWIYDTKGPAKSLSPYSYYRLMPWKAFLNGYTGVGFWAYADSGWGESSGSTWDDFDGEYPDFAVIYEGEGDSIISSRRWEAWRMGIEDYEILTMYSKVRGDKAAKTLAEMVLDNPKDTSKADEVRRKILRELSDSEN